MGPRVHDALFPNLAREKNPQPQDVVVESSRTNSAGGRPGEATLCQIGYGGVRRTPTDSASSESRSALVRTKSVSACSRDEKSTRAVYRRAKESVEKSAA